MKTLILSVMVLLTCISSAPAQESDTQPEPAMSASAGDFDLAMRLYRQKRYNEAIAEFQKIVDTDPSNAAAYYMMGYAHYILDHHQEALAAFAKAFEANPSFDPRPYFR